jgi:integrase
MDEIKTTVFQRNNKQWVAEINFPADPFTGKKKNPKRLTSTIKGNAGRQEVKRKMDAYLKRYKDIDITNADTLTVQGWLKTYFDVYGGKWAQTTREGYDQKINTLVNPYIGDIILSRILPMHIENLYNTLRSVNRSKNLDGTANPRGKNPDGTDIIGYEEKTLLQVHRILHRAFKKAVGDKKMEKNPCDGVDAPSPDEYIPTVYDEELFAELLDKLVGHRMEALILIAGMCGLRRGELLGLTWEDIDFENEIINVQRNRVPTKEEGVIEKDPKTKKSKRSFAIPSVIMPTLRRCRGIGKLYVRLDGEQYHPGSVSQAFSKFLAANNLPHIRLHDMRHFNGTMMLKHGVSEKEIMERGGWSTVDMVRKYQHVLKEMDKKSADKLNNVLKKKKKSGAKTGAKA